MPSSNSKGQTTLVLILLVIIIFGGMVIFLLSFASTISQVEYTNLYTHNLLLSVMRTSTPYYTDTRCSLVSDMIHCAYYEPSWRCGRQSYTCLDLANGTILEYMEEFEDFRKNYDYLFLVEPEYTVYREGEPIKLKIGNHSLEDAKIEKIVANERLQKGGNVLNVRLIIAKK